MYVGYSFGILFTTNTSHGFLFVNCILNHSNMDKLSKNSILQDFKQNKRLVRIIVHLDIQR